MHLTQKISHPPSRRCFLPLLASPVLPSCRRSSASFAGYAFVANHEGKAIAIVDLTAFAATQHISLDGSPSQLATHSGRPAVYALAVEPGVIYEIQSDKLQLGRKLRLGEWVGGMRFSPSGDALWALCAHQFLRVGLDRFEPNLRLKLPATPVDCDIAAEGSASGGLAALSLGGTGQVLLIGLEDGTIRKRIEVGGKLGSVRFRKDGRHLMVASIEERQLVVYDVAAGQITVRLPLAVRPERFCMKGDGGQLFISGEGMDALVTVYPYQTEVAGTMLAGRSPGFLAVSDGPDMLFVANPQSGDVTIIDINTQRVMAVAPVGKDPCFITLTPNNEYALVLNRGSGDMAVLHVGTLSARRTKRAPLFTMVPVGSGPVSAVVRAV
jgi:YVTN family beta-propeller protein